MKVSECLINEQRTESMTIKQMKKWVFSAFEKLLDMKMYEYILEEKNNSNNINEWINTCNF